MTEDSILKEIHDHRDEYARKFNYDLDAIVRDLQKREKTSGRRS